MKIEIATKATNSATKTLRVRVECFVVLFAFASFVLITVNQGV